jgi:hypothetical protein
MARTGRCRCGALLKFRRGPEGYKVRCSRCNAVVRLRTGKRGASPSDTRPAPKEHRPVPPPASAPAAVQTAQSPQRRAPKIACEVCRTVVPTEADRRPACGSALPKTVPEPLPAVQQPPPPAPAAVKRSRFSLGWRGLVGGAVLVVASLITSGWFVWVMLF